MEDPHVDTVEGSTSPLEVPLLTEDKEDSPVVLDESATEENDDDDEEESGRTTFFSGRVLLLTVAALFGSLNVCLRLLYGLPGPPSPSILSMVRAWLATLCFPPLMFFTKKEADNSPTPADQGISDYKSLWKVAFELSVVNFAAQALFTVGLKTTPSARGSFLGQTTVVMVPFIASFTGETVKQNVWLGSAASMVGLILLSHDGEEPTSKSGFGVGDLFVLGGALLWSCYCVRLSQVGARFNEIKLQGAKTFLTAIQFSIWTVVSSLESNSAVWLGWRSPVAWAILVYSSVAPGCMADLLQQKGQSTINASESNLILAMEPIFTAVMGRLVLGEETGGIEKIGGSCLIFGALIAGH